MTAGARIPIVASRLAAFLRTELALSPQRWRAIGRIVVACAIATALIMTLRIPEGGWLILTILIVSMPDTGASVLRAVQRLLGTLVGCAVAIAFVIAFPQQPWIQVPAIAVVIGLLLHIAVVYLGLLKLLTPLKLPQFFKAIAPAQLLAFSTSSSGATLPVTMRQCKEKLGASKETTSFVLPLGATINMDGTALYQAVAAVFIAQASGMSLDMGAQLTIVITAVLASIGTAAVPGAGIIMLVIILEAIDVPSEGIALILGVDRILDMLRTTTNVTGDAAVCAVIAQSEKQLHPPGE